MGVILLGRMDFPPSLLENTVVAYTRPQIPPAHGIDLSCANFSELFLSTLPMEGA